MQSKISTRNFLALKYVSVKAGYKQIKKLNASKYLSYL